jgi:hypothetical protein
MIFTSLDALVPFAKQRALRGLYDGVVNDANMALMRACSHVLRLNPGREATILYTRDIGHHSGGWWKNPDYERCLHLSLAYRDPRIVGAHLPQDTRRSGEIARAFFGDEARRCWIERPYSPEGKRADVWHYRLFCDAGWNPITPRGEVYSRELTEGDWKSFSEIHGYSPGPDDAPFLKAASE